MALARGSVSERLPLFLPPTYHFQQKYVTLLVVLGGIYMLKKDTFYNILDMNTVAELRHMAKELGFSNYSKQRKLELMERIEKFVLEENSLRSKLLAASEQEIRILEKTMKEEVTVVPEDYMYGYWTRLYLAFVDKKNIVHIPVEVEQEYERLKKDTHYLEARKRNALIEQYAVACVNLYEIIEIPKFLAIIREQTRQKITEEEVKAWCKVREECRGNVLYFYQDGYLMLETYGENSFGVQEDYEQMLEKQKGKPYYVPPKDELLKYEDTIYAEENTAFHNMLSFLTKQNKWKMEDVYDICAEVQLDIRSQMTHEEVMDECAAMGIVFDTSQQEEEFHQQLLKMFDQTRLPENRGHTTEELRDLHKPKPRLDTRKKKIYPNDPCPCGSGKKYKKCCGKNNR